MHRSILLTVDGVINLALGVLLIAFPESLVRALGIPAAPAFYPNILGAVLFGIGIALLLERGRKRSGLGLSGAVAINLCGGLVMAAWLAFGELSIPLRGAILLWTLVLILIGISLIEVMAIRAARFPRG